MKRKLTVLLCLLLALPLLLAACNGTGETSSGDESAKQPDESSATSEPEVPDGRAGEFWSDAYADATAGMTNADSIIKTTVFCNGNETADSAKPENGNDVRYLFGAKDATRVVVPAEGYCITLPGRPTADYSLGKLRSQYKTDEYCLTLTYEDQNPYGIGADGNTSKDGWDLYMGEWLTEQIEDVNFLLSNKIIRTRAVQEVEVGSYTVKTYCMQINLGSKIQFPYYNVAIVRPTNTYNYFYLFVMKSSKKMLDEFDSIVASLTEIDRVGTPTNGFTSYELKPNPNWNEETRRYFDYLCNRTDVGFGAFHQGNDVEYTNWLWGEEAINATPDVYMTYQHIGWGGTPSDPAVVFNLAAQFAGGNGFDGKPVFNLTYQFTETNNATGGVYTPMFDIIRGKKDDQFRNLARAIKAYGKPILFRLNNEMNTDWTDYCGMMTLIDPDIFQMTWRRMYDVFEEEGVDNCIWIFNPITPSCPYSNWGDALCYMPGEDYVQMLGLTNYEMNNGVTTPGLVNSFRLRYTETADGFLPYFDEYPWIIGEFACGAGGERLYNWGTASYNDTVLGRNADVQEQWVRDMCDCFRNNQLPENEFCRRIKIAVWFSANDYADTYGNQTYQITNYLKLDENTMGAIQALGEYIRETKAQQ